MSILRLEDEFWGQSKDEFKPQNQMQLTDKVCLAIRFNKLFLKVAFYTTDSPQKPGCSAKRYEILTYT